MARIAPGAMAMRRPRYSSPLDRHRHRDPVPPRSCGPRGDSTADLDELDDGALEYFWQLVEASSADDVAFLWRDFEQRAAQLAQVEDVDRVVWHLGRALEASPFWSRPEHQGRREAVLRALAAAQKEPP
jgi:hypothetical protein